MPKKKLSNFESSIHVWRAKCRMTQQQLADKVGVSRQTIIQLERNRYNPSLLLAHDIADVFEVPIEQIFTFTRIGEPETMEMMDVED
ncbi:cro/CI family transcriptional regulator [Enterococcus sp. 7E2_DIV0204]|uniref:helix-turn-helix transcriptional regulator n=1 Tax=unclassified Enterococcus TaxID=2608891 RepID=UPI000A32FFF4|nr:MULTISPECIES: helix-turn-helix transcriptional regulator [unclassified Enterococcus]OTN83981.1 cro/CI family transcriptional regulator [Enterococcus sp. 7E2_DIV0204]OTP47236.1 cro/CI family transcriptional regulator [Enterococcus sp. 7D2_DIV0200]